MARELTNKPKGSQNLERNQQGSRRDFWPTTYSPFGLMRRFADDMDRMFGSLDWNDQQLFSPELDIYEKDGKLVVRADLPGVSKDNVKVDLSEHVLTIEGERKCEHEDNDQGVYTCERSERSYGHFRREIALPEGVNTDTAKANFKNGTLEITFDSPQTSKTRRRIEIQDEGGGSPISGKRDTAA
jgi:HSP20 family protein